MTETQVDPEQGGQPQPQPNAPPQDQTQDQQPTNTDQGEDTTSNEVDPNAAAGKTDGFIGSRRIRTFLIGGVLLPYLILAIPYFADFSTQTRKACRDAKDIAKARGLTFKCTETNVLPFAFGLLVFAAILMIIFIGMSIVLHCLKREGGIETITGWCLLVSSSIYFFGFLLASFKGKALFASAAGGFFIFIGEGLLPSVSAIFLALDVIKDFMAKEERRLFFNLLNLSIVSFFGFIGYAASSKSVNGGAIAMITIGYIIILGCAATYVILNFIDCLTCECMNCDEKGMVRIGLTIGLLVGAVFAAIGYWSSIPPKGAGTAGSYRVGFTVLLVGITVIWALDMGIVDKVVKKK